MEETKQDIKKVSGTIDINCYVDCPHCEEYINLFDIESLLEDNYIYNELFNVGLLFGTDDWDETITCPECAKEFKIGEVRF